MTEIVLDPGGGNETTLTESEIQRYRAEKVHTGLGTLNATVLTTTDLLPFAKRRDRVNLKIDGSVEWTGFLVKPGQDKASGKSEIKALGIAKRLEETRPDYENLSNSEVTYSQIALEEALRDYWGRTPFSNFSVTDQSTEVVSTGVDIEDVDTQTEWNNDVSPSSTDPLFVDNGFLKLGQSAYVFEAETATGGGGDISDSGASDGTVETFFDTTHSASYTASVDYTIPSDNVAVGFRARNPDDPDGDGTFEGARIELVINGENQGTVLGDKGNDNFSWSQETGYSGGDISGNTTIEFNVTQDAPSGASNYIDIVALYDDRFSYTFDNSVDSNGYLSGPELYPTTQQITTSTNGTQFNIDSLTISSTWNDTSNGQAIGLSNDGGSTFTTNSNTDSATVDFTSAGRTAQVRFTLDGFGTRTTDSPTNRFQGQEIDLYDLDGDLNNLVVIDELSLTNNHFENLQQLHSYGNFLWVIEHSDSDIGNLKVTSFLEGDETRSTPSEYDDPIDKTSRINSTIYHNKVFLRGAKNDNGTYPTAVVEDTDEINDINETIEATLKDPKITTDAGATFRAQSLLDELTDENERKGEITIPLRANITHPGYARSIDFGDGGKLKTIEKTRLEESTTRVGQTHKFEPPDDISERIRRLKRNTRDVRDKV